MKTAVFLVLLKQGAKHAMPEAEYAAFAQKYEAMRWNQLRQRFPDTWDSFSERFESVKGSLGSGAQPEQVAASVAPGGIERHPDLFDPFVQQLDGVRAEIAGGDPDAPPDGGDPSAPVETPEVDTAAEVGASTGDSWVEEFLDWLGRLISS